MAPYSILADEYYDSELHPTCANFEQLSRRFFEEQLEDGIAQRGWVLEVGAGRSVLAPMLNEFSNKLDNLVLSDISASMLSHSEKWKTKGAHLVVSDAQESAFATGGFGLVTASLGDPYNTRRFWREMYRLLAPGGMCLFTGPAFEWARAFRSKGGEEVAEFATRAGLVVNVPSFVPMTREQTEMIEQAGLIVEDVVEYRYASLNRTPSPKLEALKEENGVVIRGFRTRKAKQR